MRRFLLFIVTVMVCASGYAANYFKPGTVWEYDEFFLGNSKLITVELVDAVDPDGIPCYQEVMKCVDWEFDNPSGSDEVVTHMEWLVKVDGEKVFLRDSSLSETQWQLIYDFSLQPGEGCLIQETVLRIHKIPKVAYFKFMGMTKIKRYDVEVMELKVFWSEEESVDDSKAIRTEYWIPGVGSPDGFDGCYHYCTPEELEMVADYPDQMLMKVTEAGGDVIVEYSDGSGIAAVDAEDAAAMAVYYNLLGQRVEKPFGGIFIRVEGGRTTKVLLK